MIPRVRYNAKGRQATAGSSTHKNRKRKRPTDPTASEDENPNADIVAFKTKEDKDLDKKDRLRQEVISPKSKQARWTDDDSWF